LLYNIGSSYFCTAQQAGSYQAMHLSLSGLRALIFPLVGVWVLEQYGFMACFSAASIGLLFGLAVIVYSRKNTALMQHG